MTMKTVSCIILCLVIIYGGNGGDEVMVIVVSGGEMECGPFLPICDKGKKVRWREWRGERRRGRLYNFGECERGYY